MNNLKIFENKEFGTIRTMNIEEVWFVGKDVAEALGYTNPSDAISKHIDNEDKMQIAFHDLQNIGLSGFGTKGTHVINESGLYSLILSSKLPSAKKFKKWVTSEVLPAIRKTGVYQIQGYQPKATSVGEVVNLINMTRQSMKEQGCNPREIAVAIKQICEQFNIQLPDCFVKPQEITLQDVMDMIDFIYSKPKGKGYKKPTYEEYIVQKLEREIENGQRFKLNQHKQDKRKRLSIS